MNTCNLTSANSFRGSDRFGYRISEWSAMTGTSRVTTWRKIRAGKLKVIDYCGIKIIPESERARLFQPSA